MHQIVSGAPPRRRKLGRAAGGIAVVLVLIAATFGALRIAHAPPFVQTGRMPPATMIKARSTPAVAIDPTTGNVLLRYEVSRLRPGKRGTAVVTIDPATGAVIRTR